MPRGEKSSRSKRAKSMRKVLAKKKAEREKNLSSCEELQDSSEDIFKKLLEKSR